MNAVVSQQALTPAALHRAMSSVDLHQLERVTAVVAQGPDESGARLAAHVRDNRLRGVPPLSLRGIRGVVGGMQGGPEPLSMRNAHARAHAPPPSATPQTTPPTSVSLPRSSTVPADVQQRGVKDDFLSFRRWELSAMACLVFLAILAVLAAQRLHNSHLGLLRAALSTEQTRVAELEEALATSGACDVEVEIDDGCIYYAEEEG